MPACPPQVRLGLNAAIGPSGSQSMARPLQPAPRRIYKDHTEGEPELSPEFKNVLKDRVGTGNQFFFNNAYNF